MSAVLEIGISNIAPYVDSLGNIKAEIASLNDQADNFKSILIQAAAESGKSAFEGQKFRATVSFSSKRVVNYREVINSLVALYGIDEDVLASVISNNTEVAEGVPCVRVVARKA